MASSGVALCVQCATHSSESKSSRVPERRRKRHTARREARNEHFAWSYWRTTDCLAADGPASRLFFHSFDMKCSRASQVERLEVSELVAVRIRRALFARAACNWTVVHVGLCFAAAAMRHFRQAPTHPSVELLDVGHWAAAELTPVAHVHGVRVSLHGVKPRGAQPVGGCARIQRALPLREH